MTEDQKIQKFLQWLNDKTIAVDITLKPKDITKIQNLYDFFVLNQALYRVLGLQFSLDRALNIDFSLDLDLDLDLYLDIDPYFDLYLYLYLDSSLNKVKKNNPELYQKLEKIKKKLPNRKNKEEFKKWWQSHGKAWLEDLRKIMIEHRNIDHDWQFDVKQQKLIRQYYRANQLLTQCFHRKCHVSVEVRRYIEETILLPIAEIEKYDNPQILKI